MVEISEKRFISAKCPEPFKIDIIFTAGLFQGQDHAGSQLLRLSGMVKINLLPLPGSLSTRILPACISTNFLTGEIPGPAPV
ncbi:hypothetical protein DU86_17655 [Methanosarcina mazei]|uniref:Uncharacterized protein n=3 Tax=Methanosarcina mazei TaxID=2209 RepID=A0A0F8SHJ4_METMZ|nr:hypothetical protein MSMAW_1717 [Methanosarcina mazei WWM610]AKB71208.1 hypothetical protein MSMAC_1318 [Methanosarcina mazei C16]KKG00765.1 hypothetical protein DU31_18230 [Methanosarcina mazei]KKG05699.1 hypothetical protein DU40_14105 [Methanosarcina mazei]KKG19571.1 hypothetical protein DU34_08580 [Methanosarcina mazei]